jgi:hypothetical protein
MATGSARVRLGGARAAIVGRDECGAATAQAAESSAGWGAHSSSPELVVYRNRLSQLDGRLLCKPKLDVVRRKNDLGGAEVRLNHKEAETCIKGKWVWPQSHWVMAQRTFHGNPYNTARKGLHDA